MKKNTVTLILLFLFSFQSAVGQFIKVPFILKGNFIGLPDGKFIHLSTGYVNTEAADWKLKSDSAIIFKGKFIFEGSLSYPHGVRIYFDDSETHFQSGLFFLEKGLQNTEIDINLQNGITPVVKGSGSNEIFIKKYHIREIEKDWLALIDEGQSLYTKFKDSIPQSALRSLYKKKEENNQRKDSFLLKDTKTNHSYFVSLWLVTESLMKYGYKPLYYNVFNLIPQSIRATKTGKFLNDKISSASSTEIGKKFPVLLLQDTLGKTKQIDFKNEKIKYTLIDFWYSHCGPCIAQFPKLKEIYDQFKSKGFQIVGISIDAKKDKEAWEKAIGKYKLPWLHFWDSDHTESSRLSINAYPTTFLLGSDGKIITKNIEISELEKFLQKNLK